MFGCREHAVKLKVVHPVNGLSVLIRSSDKKLHCFLPTTCIKHCLKVAVSVWLSKAFIRPFNMRLPTNEINQFRYRFSSIFFSIGSLRIPPTSSSPEPPPPPPRNHDPSFNDSKDSNEISEAECDRDQLINSRTYGGKFFRLN